MYTTTNNYSFSVSRLTDSDLVNLFNACASEMATREERKSRQREHWIEMWYAEYLNRYDTDCLVVGKRTIVATYDECNGMRIGTAYPIHNDKYDAKTGIAVAYAKAIGIAIPDYI
jgi:hypothetical protein